MKHKRILSAICSVSIVGGMIVLPVHGADTDIFSTDFTGSDSVSSWSNAENVYFGTNDIVGNYMIADGNKAAAAPKTDSFSTSGEVCVEFDMMIPTKKADQSTDNTIGGGNTGGLALMQGDTVAGVIGYRGNGQGQPDHILSKGASGSDYINAVAGSKATAYRDQWLHYVMNVNAEKQPKT